jgi:hypothetical protein
MCVRVPLSSTQENFTRSKNSTYGPWQNFGLHDRGRPRIRLDYEPCCFEAVNPGRGKRGARGGGHIHSESIQEGNLAKKLFKGFIHISKKLRAVGLAWLGIKWFRSPSWNCVLSWKLWTRRWIGLDWLGSKWFGSPSRNCIESPGNCVIKLKYKRR